MLVHFMAINNILRPFGIPILWYFGTFWDNLGYLSRFGMSQIEKSGNPALEDGFSNQRYPVHCLSKLCRLTPQVAAQ
jgi:hypothetical protein